MHRSLGLRFIAFLVFVLCSAFHICLLFMFFVVTSRDPAARDPGSRYATESLCCPAVNPKQESSFFSRSLLCPVFHRWQHLQPEFAPSEQWGTAAGWPGLLLHYTFESRANGVSVIIYGEHLRGFKRSVPCFQGMSSFN